ncbi:MAG: BrnA antitoxin family protein [Janthinobacterium lividum]
MDRPRRPRDPFAAAEAVFSKSGSAAAPPASAVPKPATIPGARQSVTLRIDEDVLEHFQEDGPGWQDRINAALRAAAGLS